MNETRTDGYSIVNFGAEGLSDKQCEDVAGLHSRLLPHSPVVLMGHSFMTRFYYPCLTADGSICGALAYVDGMPAGFVVATSDPDTFMPRAVRRHWWPLMSSLIVSVLRRPSSIKAILEAASIQKNVAAKKIEPGVGELLSFGVLEEYRAAKFVRSRGIRISQDLIDVAVSALGEGGSTQVRAIVDQDNVPARMFYSSLGWRVGTPSVEGWSVPTMEFVKELASAPSGQRPGAVEG